MILALLFVGLGMLAGVFLYLIGLRGILIWILAAILILIGYYV